VNEALGLVYADRENPGPQNCLAVEAHREDERCIRLRLIY
jgi:hypothetical protein